MSLSAWPRATLARSAEPSSSRSWERNTDWKSRSPSSSARWAPSPAATASATSNASSIVCGTIVAAVCSRSQGQSRRSRSPTSASAATSAPIARARSASRARQRLRVRQRRRRCGGPRRPGATIVAPSGTASSGGQRVRVGADDGGERGLEGGAPAAAPRRRRRRSPTPVPPRVRPARAPTTLIMAGTLAVPGTAPPTALRRGRCGGGGGGGRGGGRRGLQVAVGVDGAVRPLLQDVLAPAGELGLALLGELAGDDLLPSPRRTTSSSRA